MSFAALALLLAGCTQVGERTQLSVGYYNVYGTSFRQLDQQIALHGPTVAGVGKALASTRVRMVPDVRFRQQKVGCAITHAKVKVQAKVTLPRLTKQRTIDQELKRAWDNLEEYARVHEAVHVAIADRYAIRIENALLALKPAKSCDQQEKIAQDTAKLLLEQHEADQLKFDQDEKDRINALIKKRQSAS